MLVSDYTGVVDETGYDVEAGSDDFYYFVDESYLIYAPDLKNPKQISSYGEAMEFYDRKRNLFGDDAEIWVNKNSLYNEEKHLLLPKR